jgi:phosphotransferase system enzyme I (PtsI)
VAHYEVAPEAVEDEIERFDNAMRKAQVELAELKAHIPQGSPAEFEAFLDLHRMILNDSALAQAPRDVIRKRRANAEWALVQEMERLVERFEEIDDPYLRERKADVQQAVERVLTVLGGGKTLAEPAISEEEKLIVVAHDLSPADMISSRSTTSAASSPTWAASPRTPRSSRARSASRRSSACTTRAR